MDFPSCHFPFRQPTGRWEENDEVGEIICRAFLFRHRSIFVTDRSLERKVGHTRTCFLFPQQRHYSALKCALPFFHLIVLYYILAYFYFFYVSFFFLWTIFTFGPSFLAWRGVRILLVIFFSFIVDADGCRESYQDPFLCIYFLDWPPWYTYYSTHFADGTRVTAM